MADVVLQPALHQNFVCSYRGISYVGKALENYTKSGIDRVYQRIYTKLAGYKLCDQKCSRQYGNNTIRWCQTCKAWKQQLQNEVKYHGKWDKKKSWKWPKGSDGITEMFIPSWWGDDEPNVQDISTACNVWLSCSKEFHIQQHVVRNLREFRNTYCAHNPHLQVSDREKDAVFDTLRDLIKDGDVSGHINVQQCLLDLKTIQNADQTNILKTVQNELSKISNNTDLMRLTQLQLYNTFMTITLDQRRHHQFWNSKLLHALRVNNLLFALTVAALSIILFIMINHKEPSMRFASQQNLKFGSNCLSEIYQNIFQQDLLLLGYLPNDKEFVGREWLINNIERELLNVSDKKTRGLVVVADMGYGKSAIVSHLLCAKSSANGQNIYKHIVAFHVCKFDIGTTRKPERFIRRLIGFFASKSPEYGNIVFRLPNSSIIYDNESCLNELEACFDQGITLPLKELMYAASETWIIVLDALDECYEKKLNRNLILELLSSRSRHLPNWVKFLITSRNTTDLSKLSKYKFQYLIPSDSRNIADIKLFMENKYSGKAEVNQTLTSFILTKSEGLFLNVITFLELNDTHESMHGLPTSLDDIYELNFGRLFENEDYSVAKECLEIISAQFEPILKNQLFDILNTSHYIDSDTFEEQLEKLSSFIHVSGVVTFKHQAILQWLTQKPNSRFSISVANGHTLISNYFMSSIEKNTTVDIVDLAIHVAQSEDESLSKLFINLNDFGNEHKHERSILHKVIWKTSSVDALKLLMHHYPVINAVNEGEIIPAFVSAAKGHLEQLKYLQSKGENISFIVPASFKVLTSDVFTKIHLIKTVYYSGYSLMHIAAQHGHLSVVEYLIDLNKSIIGLKNSLGLRPIDVACENGHLDIVKKLHAVRSDFLDIRCLYYAAKFNYKDIAEYMVELGITMNCISDEISKTTLNSVFTLWNDYNTPSLPTSIFPNDSFTTDQLRPIDSWWIIFKETPLHAAIRAGSTTIAKMLSEKFPASVMCEDGFGFTPCLTAVAYNRTELMPIFRERIAQERCSSIPTHLVKITEKFGNKYIHRMICPEGATYAHLVALFDLPEMVFYSFKERLDISWNNPDAHGTTPIHYASSRNSVFFISISKEHLKIDVETSRARNGSTVFHIAALTGAHLSMYLLTNKMQTKIVDIKDEHGRGIIHYVVLQNHSYPHNRNGQNGSYCMFQYLVEVCNHDIRHRDNFKRNLLHYAFTNGHTLIIHYLRKNFLNDFHTMLEEEDLNGLSPVQYVIANNDGYTATFLALDCINFDDIFTNSCIWKELITLMPNWEVAIIEHICRTHMPLTFILRHVVPYLDKIIRNAAFFTAALLRYHGDLGDEIWTQHTLKAIRLGTSKCSILSIIIFRPHIFHTCRKPISASPMHLLMLKSRHQNNILPMDNNNDSFVIFKLFSKPIQHKKFGCRDKHGFNIFHYALMSGNIIAARVLFEYGIKITNKRVGYADIFFICLLSKRQLHVTDHREIYDTFLKNFIDRYSNSITSRDLCKHDSLSIVHLLSLSGMEKTLQTIFEKYGLETLACSSKFRISPLYLAKLFGENRTVALLSEYMDLTLPDNAAEEYLLLSLLHNFTVHSVSGTISPLLKAHHDGAKNHTRHFWRIYAIIQGQVSKSQLHDPLQLMEALLSNFPYFLSHVSGLEAIVLSNNIEKSCKWIESEMHFLMLYVSLYRKLAASYITISDRYFIISPKVTWKLQKAVHIADLILNGTLFSRYANRISRCSTFKNDPGGLRSLYHYTILLAKSVSDVLQHMVIDKYILELRSSKMSIVLAKYDFMRSRKLAIQVRTNFFSIRPASILNPSDILDNSFGYMDVIKTTFAYDVMSPNIFEDRHGIAEHFHKYNQIGGYQVMTDPLLGLRQTITVEP